MKCTHIITVVLLLLFHTSVVFAQYSADPHSDIYKDIEIWESQGYITVLPPFRPLPEVVLDSAMKEVIENGRAKDVKKAKKYLTEINNFSLKTTVSVFGRINNIGGDFQTLNRAYGNGLVDVVGSHRLNDLVSIAVSVGGHLLANKDAETKQDMKKTYYINDALNRLEELEAVDLVSVATIDTGVAFSNRTSFAAGKKNIFLHAGFMRRSIGPFYEDGIVASPKAPQSGNMFVYWGGKNLGATWGLFALSSSQEYLKFEYNEDKEEASVEEASTRNKINKVFYYNSLSWYVGDYLEIDIFESVMFGNFNFAYLLPIKVIYAVDSGSDFSAGNLMVGAHMKYQPIPSLTIPFSILIDDISVSEYIRFNFYSKLKLAAELAVQWTPFQDYIKELKLGYQIVTPYTYTHPPTETYELYSTAYNTENHTHAGHHFATTLRPSSHRIYLNTIFSPFHFLDIGASTKVEQHSNASDGILKGPLNDGSIIDDGYSSVFDNNTSDESATFQKRFDFLTGTVETSVETAVNIQVSVPVARYIEFYSSINYSYRFTHNYNLTTDFKQENIFQLEIGVVFNKIFYNQ